MIHKSYDWAFHAIQMLESTKSNLVDLAKLAGLDPFAGELSCLDLRGLDLRGCDFRGWDLRYAKMDGAQIANADFREANVDAEEVLQTVDWTAARFDEPTFYSLALARRRPLEEQLKSIDVATSLDIIDNVLGRSERIEDITGRVQKSLIDFKKRLKGINAEAYGNLLRMIAEPDLILLHSTIVRLIYTSNEQREVEYIAELCDSYLGVNAQRQHTFYPLDERSGTKRYFDIFYPNLALAIEIKNFKISGDGYAQSQWLNALGITPLMFPIEILERNAKGRLSYNRTVDKPVVDAFLKENLPRI